MIKICQQCGQEYEARNLKQKFCCRSCSHKSLSLKIKTTCNTCGKEIYQKKSEYDKHNTHFCSVECKQKYGIATKKCLNCGKEFKYSINNKKVRKYCCEKCRNEHLPKHQKTNRKTLVCIICGKEFSVPLSSRNKCCSKECKYINMSNNAKTSDYNKNRTKKAKASFYEKYNQLDTNVILESEYINATTKILCRCAIHDTTFYMNPHGILKGSSGCKSCFESVGEKMIAEYLDNNNIPYVRQYVFDDCKDINSLRFDFYLEGKNQCVEYDGEQHYTSVTWGGISKEKAEQTLKDVQRRDAIKNQYCIDNNIDLIRIPYWDRDNIKYILSDKIHR